jgi:hypothetical protein
MPTTVLQARGQKTRPLVVALHLKRLQMDLYQLYHGRANTARDIGDGQAGLRA